MTATTAYRLRPPATDDERHTYHDIRRSELFARRRREAVYDENHPDERAPGNHPLVLEWNGEIIGTIRVDVEATLAIFRLVAIRSDVQRGGHGRAMLALAEQFARARGCTMVRSFVAPDAVGFYERQGFSHDDSVVGDGYHPPMKKQLA